MYIIMFKYNIPIDVDTIAKKLLKKNNYLQEIIEITGLDKTKFLK